VEGKFVQNLVERPEGRRLLGRPRQRWEHNIKMDLREIGLEGVYWMRLAEARDQWQASVKMAVNLRVR
jgi:hypothetical protein